MPFLACQRAHATKSFINMLFSLSFDTTFAHTSQHKMLTVGPISPKEDSETYNASQGRASDSLAPKDSGTIRAV